MIQGLSQTELSAVRQIRNSLVHQGRIPSVRELMRALGYRSPRSAAIVIEKLIERGVLRRKADGSLLFRDEFRTDKTQAQTVAVPLVGSVACGLPMLAEKNFEAMIPVSVNLARPPNRYFLLRAKGDSMNGAGIEDGDLVLVRTQATAEDGNFVVALIDGEATIKELHRSRDVAVLKPRSKNPEHKPIVLTNDFLIQGVVITTIPQSLIEKKGKAG